MTTPYHNHEPVIVYFDEDKIEPPAEVCGTCSNPRAGLWVPVGDCQISAAQRDAHGVDYGNSDHGYDIRYASDMLSD